jgi:hypothetical protein
VLNQKLSEINTSEEDKGRRIKISYVTKRGITTKTKTCTIPAEIPIDTELAAVIGLYLGDGERGDRLKFSNSDLQIIQFFLRYLMKLGLRADDIRARVSLNESSKNNFLVNQLEMFGLLRSHIFFRTGARFVKPVVEIKVESTLFMKIWKVISKEAIPFIVKDPVLRKSFLAGTFAADGGISWDKSRRRKYLQKISFSYNAKTDKKFRDLLVECLKREKIPTKISENGNTGKILIYNYVNFVRLYELGIFDLHKERLTRFYEAIKIADVFVELDNDLRSKIFSFDTQRKIAELVRSYQGNISAVLRAKRRARVEWILRLCPIVGLSFEEVAVNVKEISFNRSKLKNPSLKVVFLVFNLKGRNKCPS